VCRDPAHHQRARRLRWFGLDRDAVKDARGEWKGQQWNVDVSEVGRKLNMNNVAAAIGLANLPAIDWILLRHRENARSYDRAFDGTQVAPLVRHGGSAQVSSAWVYTIRVDARKRDTLLERLNAAGIRAGLVHVPNHRYECFSRFHRELPGTDKFSRTQLSLPCGWWVDPDQIEMIARTTLQVLNEI
jgi:dTDP-4-amino-4,6-dideoxygalactose transaminase